MSRNRNPAPKNHAGAIIVLILIILALIAASGFMIYLCIDMVNYTPEVSDQEESLNFVPHKPDPDDSQEEDIPPTSTLPEPEHVVSTATILSTGDVLMHMPVIDTGLQTDGSYDFSSIFKYLDGYADTADLALANLETTLAGTDNGFPYHGYPNFNCPDEIVTGLKDAGFDMLLTGNNHSYDTSMVGFQRTITTVRDQGLEALGTMATAEEPKYVIKEVNGIKIGMISYTYAVSVNDKGSPSLNGMPHIAEPGLCNYFYEGQLDAFYTEIDGYIQEMLNQGAEATMVFIHWGVEYQTYANDLQKNISQKLCDMGVDVIVGGHPHVVQPVALLESAVDENHKTVCLYSMGNAVSNQRLGNISSISTAHTEDGVLFSVTFCKYSDGTVYLEGVDLIPCWVNRHSTYGRMEYNILPLDIDTKEQWKELYSLTDGMYNSAEASYNRTMAIVGGGLTASQEWLASEQELRDQYYYDLVHNPDAAQRYPQPDPTEETDPTEESTTP